MSIGEGSVIEVGSSRYDVVRIERKYFAVLQGKSITDMECVWKFKRDKIGRSFYVNAHDGMKVWKLPDMSEKRYVHSEDAMSVSIPPPTEIDISAASPPPVPPAHSSVIPALSVQSLHPFKSQQVAVPQQRLLCCLGIQGLCSAPLCRNSHIDDLNSQCELGETCPLHAGRRSNRLTPKNDIIAPIDPITTINRTNEIIQPTPAQSAAVSHETVQYLWYELQKAASEVDTSRRVGVTMSHECEKLKKEIFMTEGDLIHANSEIKSLREERDAYKHKLETTLQMNKTQQQQQVQLQQLQQQFQQTPSQAHPVQQSRQPQEQSHLYRSQDLHQVQPQQLQHMQPPPPQQQEPVKIFTPTKALLVGVSYQKNGDHFTAIDEVNNKIGVFSPLYTGTFDVSSMKEVMTSSGLGPNNMRVLSDDRIEVPPTRSNILSALDWLVANARPGDQLLLYLKGHGAAIGDGVGCFLPSDCGITGVIRSDTFLSQISRLPFGVRLNIIADCAIPHSVGVIDLPYRLTLSSDGSIVWDNAQREAFPVPADVYLFHTDTVPFLELLKQEPIAFHQIVQSYQCAVPSRISSNRTFTPNDVLPRLGFVPVVAPVPQRKLSQLDTTIDSSGLGGELPPPFMNTHNNRSFSNQVGPSDTVDSNYSQPPPIPAFRNAASILEEHRSMSGHQSTPSPAFLGQTRLDTSVSHNDYNNLHIGSNITAALELINRDKSFMRDGPATPFLQQKHEPNPNNNLRRGSDTGSVNSAAWKELCKLTGGLEQPPASTPAAGHSKILFESRPHTPVTAKPSPLMQATVPGGGSSGLNQLTDGFNPLSEAYRSNRVSNAMPDWNPPGPIMTHLG